MKLRDIVPEAASILGKDIELSRHLQQFEFISKAVGSSVDMSKSRSPTLGIDYVINQWVREQSAFRRRLYLDLIALAHNVAEIRGPITVIVSEVFRKGFDILPKFATKCIKCGLEYKSAESKCLNCNSEEMKVPDEVQLGKFKEMISDCNVFDQSLEDVLRQFDWDMNAVDNAYLYIAKEYKLDAEAKRIISKPLEIRRVHPAIVELDLTIEGIPKQSNWFCFVHRKGEGGDQKIYAQSGECPECKFPLEPAMYILDYRGKKIYLSGSEMIRASKFSPDEMYGYCYDDQTEILTKTNGWVLFNNLTDLDEVATLNPENSELVYQKPTKMWKQDYQGDMYELDNKYGIVHLKVTPNHRLFVKVKGQTEFSLQEADQVMNKRFFSMVGGAKWEGIEEEFFILPSLDIEYKNDYYFNNKSCDDYNVVHCAPLKIKMDDWLEFLGYWIAEGEASKSSLAKIVKISQKVGAEKWNRIRSCLLKLPFPFRYYGHKFYIEDMRLNNYLTKFSGSVNKSIPDQFKGLCQRQLRILLDALMLGDGSWKRYPSSGTYTSISRKLIDDVSEITIKLGYSNRLLSYAKKGSNRTVLNFTDRKTIGSNKIKGKYADKLVPYKGKIFCCEVPKFHILLVRSRGRTVFSGNSAILTIFEKTLSLIGMDKVLFRHFFERKTPPGILMVHTDDVEGLRREKINVQRMVKENPDDLPWVGVSARQGTRGRAEFIKLFPTLAEYEFSQQKTDIRERIAAMWGVTPIWQGALEASGGISTQTQQLVVTSRVVEKEQRIFNEKIFPFICKAFGITDWEIVLRQPEEKAEQTRLTFMQQRISAANMLNQMGFDVKITSEKEEIDNIQFEVSGKPNKPTQQAFGSFGGGFGLPESGQGAEGETGFPSGEESSPFKETEEKSINNNMWVGQLNKSGYTVDDLLGMDITDRGFVNFWFVEEGKKYLAKFTPKGKLRSVKEVSTKLGKSEIKKFPIIEGEENNAISDDEL